MPRMGMDNPTMINIHLCAIQTMWMNNPLGEDIYTPQGNRVPVYGISINGRLEVIEQLCEWMSFDQTWLPIDPMESWICKEQHRKYKWNDEGKPQPQARFFKIVFLIVRQKSAG